MKLRQYAVTAFNRRGGALKNSDLLRGFQLSITHNLFRALEVDSMLPVSQRRIREFDPHLSRVSASSGRDPIRAKSAAA